MNRRPPDISPVKGSITSPDVGTGLKEKTPPLVTIEDAELGEFSQKLFTINEASSCELTIRLCKLEDEQIPDVAYSIEYVRPAIPPVISPVEGSIISPDEGKGLKEKTPPLVTMEEAEFGAPSQKSLTTKEGSSSKFTFKLSKL